MKQLILITLFILFSLNSFSQKVITPKSEIKDLKEICLKYTIVIFQGPIGKLNIGIETEEEGFCRFYDEKTSQDMKFNSHASVLNYMAKNGWLMKQFIGSSDAPVYHYVFEKKE